MKKHPARPYMHLKNVSITGFVGSTGQLELLIHIAENAPALETLTIDRSNKSVKDPWGGEEGKPEYVASIHRTVRNYLEGKISPKCSLELL